MPTRQQTLRATIDWSHQVLSPAEQRLFRRLAVFAAPCTIEAAEAVCDSRQDLGMDVLEGMGSVVDQSLLRRSRGGRRRAPVRDAGDDPRVRARAARGGGRGGRSRAGPTPPIRWCWPRKEGAEICGPEPAAWLARFDLELDNLRAALDHLIAAGNAEWATRLATALLPYWRRRELLAEGRERLTAALGAVGASPHTRAQALYAASLLTGEQGDGPTTRALLDESVALYRELGDERAALVALNALAVACQLMGDLAAARTHLETVLREARRAGRRRQRGARPQQPGQRGPRHRRPRRGPPRCTRNAARSSRSAGTGRARPGRINQGGDVARDAGDRAEAGALYGESLRIFREAGDVDGVATALADLARLAREDGDLAPGARPAAGRCSRSARSAGARWCACWKSWPPWPRPRARPSARSSCSPPRPGCATGSACPPRSRSAAGCGG